MKYLSTVILASSLATMALSKHQHHHSSAFVEQGSPVPVVPTKYNGTWIIWDDKPDLTPDQLVQMRWDVPNQMSLRLTSNFQGLFGTSYVRGTKTIKIPARCYTEFDPEFIDYPDYNRFGTYLGIKSDPLGKTSDQYHVRQTIDLDDGFTETFQVWYRVSDLAPVYLNELQVLTSNPSTIVDNQWTWYVGGLTQYQGSFSPADFRLPGC